MNYQARGIGVSSRLPVLYVAESKIFSLVELTFYYITNMKKSVSFLVSSFYATA